MPRKLDSETRVHFRSFDDDTHSQKRAFCLHCNRDACADNIQRMKNHLLKCESYLSNLGNEPVFQLLDGPIPSENPIPGMGPHAQPQPQVLAQGVPQPGSMPDGSTPGPSHPGQDPNASAMGGIPTTPVQPKNDNSNNGNASVTMTVPPAPPSAAAARVAQNSLDRVRQAIGRSSRRLENLETVLKTQVQDGMHNAATHVRAAIRDERDRLFKLSQTLVKQELRLREAQNSVGTF